MMESVDTEFKELDRIKGTLPESISKEIVAFANTEGGELYVGIRNDGSVAGVTDPDDIMSYADLSRSQGAVYARLGFVREGTKTFPGGAASAKYRLKRVLYE